MSPTAKDSAIRDMTMPASVREIRTGSSDGLRVLHVPLDDAPPRTAARAWLAVAQDVIPEYAASADIERAVAAFAPDVVWIDGGAPLARIPAGLECLATLDAGLVLTRGATLVPALLGWDDVAPTHLVDAIWRDEADDLFLFESFSEYPRIRGHAAFRRHPLFDGLGSGTFTWCARQGERWEAVMYRRPDWPRQASVVAIERAYIHYNVERATIWEYRHLDDVGDAAPPRALCIGAYLPFDSSDPIFRPNLERLAANALRHVSRRTREVQRPAADPAAPMALRRRGLWRLTDARAIHDATMPLPDPPALDGPSLPLSLSPLRLDGSSPEDPFTLAGRRMMVAGTEGGGVDEIWAHPVRIARNVQIRIDDALAPPTTTRVSLTPLSIDRHHTTTPPPPEHRPAPGHEPIAPEHEHASEHDASPPRPATTTTERLALHADLPATLLEWTNPATAPNPTALKVTWETDLRLMWPYPAGALGPLRWRAEGRTLLVRADDTDDVACYIISEPPLEWLVSEARTSEVGRSAVRGTEACTSETIAPHAAALRCGFRVLLEPGRSVRLAVVGAVSDDELRATLAALREPATLVRARAAALRALRDGRLSTSTPEPDVDQAIEWAKARLDGFLVETPGVGRSLVAGYWRSSPGWGDGRPGYAWYFARDAVWTALASLAAGDFAASRDVIRFLGEHQDLSGKILHECTTSGSVHYDAADSTSLYLLLCARHDAWTGDIGFLREQWPRIVRALEFCRSTDTDGDGLIENTRVGHGWIEFGRLGGGKVTYYNAAIWAAALRELATTAENIGERDAAARLASDAKRTRLALEHLFHETGRGYALKAWQSEDTGEWQRDFTPTATHAVPLLLGVADAGRAGGWLDAIASPDFSADWGVRMVARSDPAFKPTSYHGGAVWPLYTGWASWAEFTAGRAEAGYRHWRVNLALAYERQKGAWDEVLHGLERRSVGVCPDQAWSTAMAIAPFVYGMLGAVPDAARGRLRLRPQIPAHWDRLELRNLAMGDALITLSYRRDGASHTFTVDQTGGAIPIRVIFEPALPAKRLRAAFVDDAPARLDDVPFGERLLVPVQLVLDHERTLVLEAD